MRFRKILCSALASLFVFSAAGCTSSQTASGPKEVQKQETETTVSAEPKEKVTLQLWSGFTGPDGEILKEIITRFNKANEGKIEVKMDVMGWDVLAQKLPVAIATKSAPGLTLLIGDTIPQYLQNDALEPLDDFFDKTGLQESNYVKNVLDIGKFNDKYYAMPMQFNLIYLYWNKTLFKEAGLDPEKPPVTMDELASYAEKLTIPEKNQYGFGMAVKGAPQYWTSFFWNNGGEIFDLAQKKSLLNALENIKTLEWMQDLAINKKVTPSGAGGAEIDNLLMSGKLGMVINGPWLVNGLKSNNIDFGMTAVPKGSTKQEIISGGIGYAIPAGTSQEVKDAAYEFIKYWMSPEVLKEWSLKNGFPAWENSVINDPEVKADPIQKAISPLNVMGRPYNPEAYSAISAIDNDALWPMIEGIIAGAIKPEDAIKQTSDKIDEIFKTN